MFSPTNVLLSVQEMFPVFPSSSDQIHFVYLLLALGKPTIWKHEPCSQTVGQSGVVCTSMVISKMSQFRILSFLQTESYFLINHFL